MSDLKVGLVISRFNALITEQLRLGAMDAWYYHGGLESSIVYYYVPGAFEIPGCVKQLQKTKSLDAIITLGAVIRGGTPHFDFVAGESARKIADMSIESPVPIIFGILTTDTKEQALVRSGTHALNKGWEVMEAALETIKTYNLIQSS
tara:strand:+ start:1570 stop:2013 length:444 start_codon:yes stop_codon:yes gene_type:complete